MSFFVWTRRDERKLFAITNWDKRKNCLAYSRRPQKHAYGGCARRRRSAHINHCFIRSSSSRYRLPNSREIYKYTSVLVCLPRCSGDFSESYDFSKSAILFLPGVLFSFNRTAGRETALALLSPPAAHPGVLTVSFGFRRKTTPSPGCPCRSRVTVKPGPSWQRTLYYRAHCGDGQNRSAGAAVKTTGERTHSHTRIHIHQGRPLHGGTR